MKKQAESLYRGMKQAESWEDQLVLLDIAIMVLGVAEAARIWKMAVRENGR